MKKISFNEHKNIIGQTVHRLRRLHGLTQGELSAKMQTMGVSIDQRMISRIERDKRIVTDYELACLCRIFHVSEREMLSDFYKNLDGDS